MLLLFWSLVTLLCLSLAGADPLHIPITRRSGILDFANARDSLRAKYGYQNAPDRLLKMRQSSAGVSIINQNTDTSYLATVSIGTPPQNFNLVLDTGSSDLWVVNSTCATCDPTAPSFNPSSSSTFQTVSAQSGQSQSITIQYGSGTVEGDLVKDTVSLAGFQTTQQSWLLADKTSSSLLTGSNAGIMGLAFQAIASTGAIPFWQSLINANQLSSPEMSFWVNRLLGDLSAPQETFGGVFTLGGTNSSLFTGDIEFLNLAGGTTPQYWLLDISAITVQGKAVNIPSAGVAAAIDTGTTLIGGPKAAVDAIYAAVPGAQALTGQLQGFYGFPCNTDVSVTMSFGGKAWPISPADMNIGRADTGSSMCVGGIFDLNSGSSIAAGGGNPSWVVGDTFLKNVYSVFRSNPASVGFAELSSAAGGSSGSPGSSTGTGAGPSTTGSSGTPATISTSLPLILLSLIAGILTLV